MTLPELFQMRSCPRCEREVVFVYFIRGVPTIIDPSPDRNGKVTVAGQKFRRHLCAVRPA